MINVGILGVTAYGMRELLKLLLSHSEVNVSYLGAKSNIGTKISEIYPELEGRCDLKLEMIDVLKISQDCDLVFTNFDEVIDELYNKGVKIIDLSGNNACSDLAVYGLSELYKNKIKDANLIKNPLCHAIASVLGAAPLIKNGFVLPENIIVDSKIGVSEEYAKGMKAYKVSSHPQTFEIEEEYSKFAGKSVMISFTPHLIPKIRGVYSTIYMNLTDDYTDEQLLDAYKFFYEDCPFVRVCDKDIIPETNSVLNKNFIDIGLKVDRRLKRVVVFATLDNLIKGLAGQAIQNMNIMFGLDEKTGF